jgi:predicted ribosome quality control (RQC) complex YloA/Tae2 family protein
LTSYARTTESTPSGFVTRLRKYLKTRRVTSVSQIGTDRIIEFQFSDGLYKLYLEFYAGGNIVLTDGDLKVLALLRNVEEGAEHERLRVGLQYNLSLRQNYAGIPELTKERVREGLQKAVDRQKEQPAAGKKAKKAAKDALRKALAVSITECPPLLVDHALHMAKFDANLKPEEVLADEELLGKLVVALKEARRLSETITASEPIRSYILAKPNPAASKEEAEGSDKANLLYDDFHPFRPQQFENSEYTFLEFDGFNKTVDEFFSSIEGQKLESKLHERELLAKKKLEQARKEHANRIGGLQQVQELNVRKAEAILANVHRVAEATEAVNGLIAQGMDWGTIALLIEREQTHGNPVAQLIQLPLKLYENTITLLLGESNEQGEGSGDEGYESSSVSEESDEDAPSSTAKKASKVPQAKKLAIDINLGLSAWANSSEYYDHKKSAAGKEERTKQASEKALKSHERKVAEDLKKGLKQEKEVLRPVRKQHWFEKFIYFVSSDGYLVLGGKDAQQNEILYKRWLRKGDVFVHADLKGAVPLVIKNKPNSPDAPIPPSTLSQAGHLSVSTSEAWDSKAVMSAWWVNSNQVSKTGQAGEYLAPGLFNIKGKKEYLPPAQLIVGLAVMFEISEESKARHNKHRVTEAPADVKPDTIQEEARELPQDSETDSDSDEDFPDAKIESASEEEFPDAKIEDDSDNSDGESDSEKHVNPLQSTHDDAEDKEGTDRVDGHRESRDNHINTAISQTEISNMQSGNDAGSVADTEQTQSKSGQRRHLSARERRLLRKGQLPNTPSSESATVSTPEPADDSDTAEQSNAARPSGKRTESVFSQSSKVGTQGPLPRGKRSKAKKLAAKYADQDEEDRALAMRLLGSQTGQKAAEEEAKTKRAKEEEAQANKQRRREQHLRAQALGKAAEEARHAALEGPARGDDGADEEAMKELLDLDAFTGRPLPGDEILAAIPVCAPWSSLASYKYKVKIQPGAVKRGKAVREILSRWDAAGKDPRATDKTSTDTERIWPKEIDLIRGWKEPEVVGIMPVSKVRIMMAGGGGGGGGGGGAKSKGKSGRGGRGSKKR